LAIAWVTRALLRKDRNLVAVWTESPVTVLIILFLLVNLISLLNAWDLRRSLLSLMRLSALLGVYILIVAMVRRRRDVEIAVGFLLLTGLAICLLGVWESVTDQYLWYLRGQERPISPGAEQAMAELASQSGARAVKRIITVFVDYNFMGGYMAVLLGLVGGCAMATRRRTVRLALAGFAVLILYNAVQTGSRGGIVAVSVAMLALLLLSRIRLRWFMLVVLAAVLLGTLPLLGEMFPRFTRGGISADALSGARLGFWKMALRMGSDHPIIGVGIDNFVSLYPFYRASPAPMGRWYAHNMYLQMWAEGGAIGLLALLLLVTAVVLTCAQALRQAQDEAWRSLVAGILAAFLGYAVFASTSNCLHDQPFWLLMALSTAALRAGRDRVATEDGRSQSGHQGLARGRHAQV
jgi:O-antigen ligase